MNPQADEIIIRQEGRAGRITLNRPAALNALTYPQIGQIRAALEAWREAGHEVWIVTGRPTSVFDVSEAWLRRYGVAYSRLVSTTPETNARQAASASSSWFARQSLTILFMSGGAFCTPAWVTFASSTAAVMPAILRYLIRLPRVRVRTLQNAAQLVKQSHGASVS